MNESVLRQLKVIVERPVRPVRASVLRKRKMREELLAHVVGVFEEEAKLGDEQAALARTRERFGPPADLTGQLQASVSRVDCLHRFSENVVGYGAGESALRLAARVATVVGAASVVALGSAILMQTLRGQGSEWLTVARVPSLVAPLLVAFLVFGGTLLTYGMRHALFGPAGRSWLLAGLVAAAAWIMIPVTIFAACLAALADMETSWWAVVPVLAHGVLVPVGMVAAAYLVESECRHAREWASLQID